jgi:hypothetical protein
MFSSRWLIAVLIVVGFNIVDSSKADVTFSTVALSGQLAPGTPGLPFAAFLANGPSINSNGDVAFYARVSGADDFHNRGIWTDETGSLQIIARTGDQAPDTANGTSFIELEAPYLSDSGKVLFYGRLTGSSVDSNNEQGLWTHDLGSLQLLAREGNPAPDTAVAYRSFTELTFNPSGQASWQSSLQGTGVIGGFNDQAYFVGATGSVQLAARGSMVAPGTSTQFTSMGVYSSLNASGEIVFRARLQGPGLAQGIWTGLPGSLQLVARDGQQAPDLQAGVTFDSLFDPRINNNGDVVFQSYLTGTNVTDSNSSSIWTWTSGTLQPAVRAGNPAPGTPSGVSFLEFEDPLINATGKISFRGTIAGTGITNNNNEGLWAGSPSNLTLIAREGDAAVGTSAGVVYGTFSELNFSCHAMNAVGQLAFETFLAGTGVTSANNFGIWATDLNGILHLIARSGDAFDVGNGDIRTIASLRFNPGGFGEKGSGGEDGHMKVFNDAGQLAFWASFTDGSAGIFIANVPEPTGAVQASMGLCWTLFVVGKIRRRK